MDEVYRVLKEEGFTPDELIKLEWLSDPKICAKAGLFPLPFPGKMANKKNVVRYLRAWANILEAEETKKLAKQIDEISIDDIQGETNEANRRLQENLHKMDPKIQVGPLNIKENENT